MVCYYVKMRAIIFGLKILLSVISAGQAIAIAILSFIIVHIQLFGGYFDNYAGPFHDDPFSYTLLLIFLGASASMILLTYIILSRKERQKSAKGFTYFVLALQIVSLLVILYLYVGPLASCMALPDACGG